VLTRHEDDTYNDCDFQGSDYDVEDGDDDW
jgi:hypothetical protein